MAGRRLAQSAHYEIDSEYESVFLTVRQTGRRVLIGDFYGDVEKAVISPDESYCAMVGCGVIVYDLREPFTPYAYHTPSDQWKEFDRDGKLWYTDVTIVKGRTLSVTPENGETKIIVV